MSENVCPARHGPGAEPAGWRDGDSGSSPTHGQILPGPLVSDSGNAEGPSGGRGGTDGSPAADQFATALRLSNGRPLLIAAAQARVQIAAAQAEKANVLWLPNLNTGMDYIRHTGGTQGTTGDLLVENTNSFIAGGSAVLRVGNGGRHLRAPCRSTGAGRAADRYADGSQRSSRNNGRVVLQRADGARHIRGNDRCDDQGGRHRAPGRIAGQGTGGTRRNRPRTHITGRIGAVIANRAAAMAGVERQPDPSPPLDPSAMVVPLEPDHLQVTLIAPSLAGGRSDRGRLDESTRAGLASRMVRATLIRLRRERLRPLDAEHPGHGQWHARLLVSRGHLRHRQRQQSESMGRPRRRCAQVVWQLDNLGFGYQAKVREQRGEAKLANIELFNVQDHVAAEVAQAKADVDSATVRVDTGRSGPQTGAGFVPRKFDRHRADAAIQRHLDSRQSASRSRRLAPATSAGLRQLLSHRGRFQPSAVPIVLRAGLSCRSAGLRTSNGGNRAGRHVSRPCAAQRSAPLDRRFARRIRASAVCIRSLAPQLPRRPTRRCGRCRRHGAYSPLRA